MPPSFDEMKEALDLRSKSVYASFLTLSGTTGTQDCSVRHISVYAMRCFVIILVVRYKQNKFF